MSAGPVRGAELWGRGRCDCGCCPLGWGQDASSPGYGRLAVVRGPGPGGAAGAAVMRSQARSGSAAGEGWPGDTAVTGSLSLTRWGNRLRGPSPDPAAAEPRAPSDPRVSTRGQGSDQLGMRWERAQEGERHRAEKQACAPWLSVAWRDSAKGSLAPVDVLLGCWVLHGSQSLEWVLL